MRPGPDPCSRLAHLPDEVSRVSILQTVRQVVSGLGERAGKRAKPPWLRISASPRAGPWCRRSEAPVHGPAPGSRRRAPFPATAGPHQRTHSGRPRVGLRPGLPNPPPKPPPIAPNVYHGGGQRKQRK